MPSPLAHCSLAIVAWPTLTSAAGEPVARWRRWALLGMLLVALGAPDIDVLIDPLLGRPMFATHGGPTHSLAAGVIFAMLFAGAARSIVRAPVVRLAVIGLLASWSHIAMDACTTGRGVMLLWPLSDERFAAPVPLFVGVRHSEWDAWRLHAITLGTEAVFAAGVWLTASVVRARSGAGPRPVPAVQRGAALRGAAR